MKKLVLLLLLIPVLATAQSSNQNYIKITSYKQPNTTPVDNPGGEVANVQVSYFDGLGRPIQQIAKSQSNTGKNIVTHIEYDVFGRQVKDYLPYKAESSSLDYVTDALGALIPYYSSSTPETTGNPNFDATQYPYSEKLLENSPLNRVFRQGAPGNDWALNPTGPDHSIKFEYLTNAAEEVKLYKATTTWNATAGLHEISLVDDGGFHDADQLYKTITKNENWVSGNNNTTEEFKDEEGKVVLKKTYNNGDSYETYYVYDIYGNLTYVLPPLVTDPTSQLESLCYQYKYDYRNRLVEKKLPGKQWEFIVYDKLDRPVATGPAFSPFADGTIGVLITQYETFGRVIQTGWKIQALNPSSRSNWQTTINNGTNPFVLTTSDILTKNYYDNYTFTGAPNPIPTTIENNLYPVATNVKGMPTGSWVRVLDLPANTNGETTYTLYDTKYRPVRNYQTNYLSGYTQTDSKLDFSGKTEYTLTRHKRTTADVELVIKDMFEYTLQDRLLLHKQQITSMPSMAEQLIVKNTYDELGQLVSKNVGGNDTTGDIGLQKIDYNYNVRGWLKGINDITDIGTENDLFSFKLNYNTFDTAQSLFNGNISETLWNTGSDNTKRKYEYSYDHLNRLLKADYSKPDNPSAPNNYLEELSYDKGGNILSLKRNGDMDTDGAATVFEIDNLTYTYESNSNKLLKVFDNTNVPQGFKDDSDGISDDEDDYTYDANGNMKTDTNKNITSIEYNHLNLPVKIIFENNVGMKIDYIYNALGQKLRKVITQRDVVKTDYINGFQYKEGVLQFFPHAEGYVAHTAGSYNYVFNYTDHLGNIRLSYGIDPTTQVLKIIEENHYFPFGLKHTNYNSDELMWGKGVDDNIILAKGGGPVPLPIEYKYKFQGQDRQDELGLNWDSFKWRNYDYAIGRFMCIDPLAEKYSYQSPYNFSENRVVDCRELEGLEAVKSTDGNVVTVTIKVKPINNTANTNSPISNEQMNTAMNNMISQTEKSYSGPNMEGQQVNVKMIVDAEATLTVTFNDINIDPSETNPEKQMTAAGSEGMVVAKDHGNTQTGDISISSQNNWPQPSDTPTTSKGTPGHTGSHEIGHIMGLEHKDKSVKDGNLMREGSKSKDREITKEQRTDMLKNIPQL